jgi:hypothetical protein
MKLSPRDEFCPLGGVKLSPGLKFSYLFLHSSKQCSPLGVNEGVNILPRGQFSPLGARGEVKNGLALSVSWTQSYNFDLQRQRCKKLQRN